MSAFNCMQCFLRATPTISLSRSIATRLTSRAPFSTTALAAAGPRAGGSVGVSGVSGMSKHIRKGRNHQTTQKKKGKRRQRSGWKAPASGERKAFRKRIILSNDNALPVPEMKELSAEAMRDADQTGRVLALPDALVDKLRAIEAFRPTQCWGLFRSPSMLLRAETTDLSKRMLDAAAKKETLRLVITGDKLSGKSMLMLQAITNAYLNNWIVFNISEAQDLSNASTDYAVIPGTNPVKYSQQAYALKMIQALRKANGPILSKLNLVHNHSDLTQTVDIGTTVMSLAETAREVEGAWPIFMALWKELTTEGHGRPPILFAADGLAHIMKVSAYRSPAFELIHAHDLDIVRRFVDGLAGTAPLPNGGAVIGATSGNNAPRSPSLKLALAQRLAEASNGAVEVPARDPYFREYDPRVDAALATVQVLNVNALSKAEARALLEYWAASGILRLKIDEAVVSEKMTLGGNGIVGEMERASLLTMKLK